MDYVDRDLKRWTEGPLSERYTLDEARAELARGDSRAVAKTPHRDDDVAAWLKRMRDQWSRHGETWREWRAVDRVLDRYRECADYGLTLRAEHDGAGDP